MGCKQLSCPSGRVPAKMPQKRWLSQTHAFAFAPDAPTEGLAEEHENFRLVVRLRHLQPASGQIRLTCNAAIPVEEAGQVLQPGFGGAMRRLPALGSQRQAVATSVCRKVLQPWPRSLLQQLSEVFVFSSDFLQCVVRMCRGAEVS